MLENIRDEHVRFVVNIGTSRYCGKCGAPIRAAAPKTRTASLKTATPKPAVTTADSQIPPPPDLATKIRERRAETRPGIVVAAAPSASSKPAPRRTEFAPPPPSLAATIKKIRQARRGAR